MREITSYSSLGSPRLAPMAASRFEKISERPVADRGASMLRWSRHGRVAGARVVARVMRAKGARSRESSVDYRIPVVGC